MIVPLCARLVGEQTHSLCLMRPMPCRRRLRRCPMPILILLFLPYMRCVFIFIYLFFSSFIRLCLLHLCFVSIRNFFLFFLSFYFLRRKKDTFNWFRWANGCVFVRMCVCVILNRFFFISSLVVYLYVIIHNWLQVCYGHTPHRIQRAAHTHGEEEIARKDDGIIIHGNYYFGLFVFNGDVGASLASACCWACMPVNNAQIEQNIY